MRVKVEGETLQLDCSGFVWAGGQEKMRGSLSATFQRAIGKIEWDVTVEMDQPIKSVTTVIRDVPRGKVSFGGGQLFDPKDIELLAAYPFGGGDLHGPGAGLSMSTAVVIVQTAADDCLVISPLDDKVRPKRFYLQPGERSYRVEAVYEHDAWRNDRKINLPRWRLAYTKTFEGAVQTHLTEIERLFNLPAWDTRNDVPGLSGRPTDGWRSGFSPADTGRPKARLQDDAHVWR
jgi:hypothetical protein